MLDVLVESVISRINEDLSLQIEEYNGYLHSRFTKFDRTTKAPNAEEQTKFALKLINQLKILIDLL